MARRARKERETRIVKIERKRVGRIASDTVLQILIWDSVEFAKLDFVIKRLARSKIEKNVKKEC